MSKHRQPNRKQSKRRGVHKKPRRSGRSGSLASPDLNVRHAKGRLRAGTSDGKVSVEMPDVAVSVPVVRSADPPLPTPSSSTPTPSTAPECPQEAAASLTDSLQKEVDAWRDLFKRTEEDPSFGKFDTKKYRTYGDASQLGCWIPEVERTILLLEGTNVVSGRPCRIYVRPGRRVQIVETLNG